MTVKFETIAQAAPTGVAYTVWVSIPSSNNTSGIAVNWSDDTGLPGLWQSTLTYTGDYYTYLAGGTITVPPSKAGPVTLTADAGAYGRASHTITFEDWGADPVLGGPLTNRLLDVLPDDTGGIDFSAQVAKTNRASVAGAEVQWFTVPNVNVVKLYNTSNTPLPSVRGGHWTPVLTDVQGNATVKVIASRTLAVTMQVNAPGVQFNRSATGYFINPDDPNIPTVFPAPRTFLFNGMLPISPGQTQWDLTLPQLSSQWAGNNYSAYLYFQGNEPDVPWAIGDTSIMTAPLRIEVPTSIVKLSNDLSANQTLLFVQSRTGQVSKSQTLAFGAYIQ